MNGVRVELGTVIPDNPSDDKKTKRQSEYRKPNSGFREGFRNSV